MKMETLSTFADFMIIGFALLGIWKLIDIGLLLFDYSAAHIQWVP